jgi:arabinosaccharide transport system substrate-binding protein
MKKSLGLAALLWLLASLGQLGIPALPGNVSLAANSLTIWSFDSVQINHMKQVAPLVKSKFGVDLAIEMVNEEQLIPKYQAALLSRADIPDLIEMGNWNFFPSFFKGNPKDIPLVDLTNYLKRSPYWAPMVKTRLDPLTWKGRGGNRIYAIGPDVHPAVLAYNDKAWKQAGIDLSQIVTWDEFIAAGRKVTKDTNNDGKTDVYALVSPREEFDTFDFMLQQQGIGTADPEDTKFMVTDPRFQRAVETFTRIWDTGIAATWDWGQNFNLMKTGKILSVAAPDWYINQMKTAMAGVTGWKCMPLPTFPGSKYRTGAWGGCGMAVSKSTKNPKLAFDVACFLFYDRQVVPGRYQATGVLPPQTNLWDLEIFRQPVPLFDGQKVGELQISLAKAMPPLVNNQHTLVVAGKIRDFLARAQRGEFKDLKQALRNLEKECQRQYDLDYK